MTHNEHEEWIESAMKKVKVIYACENCGLTLHVLAALEPKTPPDFCPDCEYGPMICHEAEGVS